MSYIDIWNIKYRGVAKRTVKIYLSRLRVNSIGIFMTRARVIATRCSCGTAIGRASDRRLWASRLAGTTRGNRAAERRWRMNPYTYFAYTHIDSGLMPSLCSHQAYHFFLNLHCPPHSYTSYRRPSPAPAAGDVFSCWCISPPDVPFFLFRDILYLYLTSIRWSFYTHVTPVPILSVQPYSLTLPACFGSLYWTSTTPFSSLARYRSPSKIQILVYAYAFTSSKAPPTLTGPRLKRLLYFILWDIHRDNLRLAPGRLASEETLLLW